MQRFRKEAPPGLRLLGVDADLVNMLLGHTNGVSGDVYTDAAMIMPLLKDAVATIPEVATSSVVAHRRAE
jgi:hypothetical protein